MKEFWRKLLYIKVVFWFFQHGTCVFEKNQEIVRLLKTLQELTLLDKFLFDEAMEDKETYEALLRIILGEEQLRLLSEAETEKELRKMPWLKSIRVDVFSRDTIGTIYNTEMQKERREDLIRRMRFYQALIDSSLLPPGEVNYNKMAKTKRIFLQNLLP